MSSIEIGLRHGIGLKHPKLFRMAVTGMRVNAEALAWERKRLADDVPPGTDESKRAAGNALGSIGSGTGRR